MFFFLILLICLVTLFAKRNDKPFLTFLPCLAVLAILVGGNVNNPDNGIYFDIYYGGEFFNKDVAFGCVVWISRYYLKLNVDEFRFIICLISLILLFSSVTKIGANPYLFFLLYLSFQIYFHAVQLRNFLGISILIFSFVHFYFNKRYLLFFLGVLLASLFQKLYFIFIFFFLLVFFIAKWRYFKYFLIFCGLTLGVLIQFDFAMNLISNILKSLNIEGLEQFTERVTNLGRIYSWVFYFLDLIIMHCLKTKFFLKTNFSEKYILFFNKIYFMQVGSIICLFLYVINPTYNRILYGFNIFTLLFIVLTVMNEFKKLYFSKKIIYVFLLICYCLFMFLINIFLNSDYFSTIFLNFYTHNWILFGEHSQGNWLEGDISDYIYFYKKPIRKFQLY